MDKEIENLYLELNQLQTRVNKYSTQTIEDKAKHSQILNTQQKEIRLIQNSKLNTQPEPKYKQKRVKVKNLILNKVSTEDEEVELECLLNVGVIESENQFYEYVFNQFKQYNSKLRL